jgi:hypothetical protein
MLRGVAFGKMFCDSKRKSGANSRRGLTSDVTTMPADQRLRIRQSHPFASGLLGAKAAKHLEHCGDIVRRNATAIILDVKGRGLRPCGCRDAQFPRASGHQSVDGIAQEIADNLGHGQGISVDLW